MMENQNTFDMTENIPDEMFEIIGLEKDEEVLLVRESDTGPMHGEDLKKIK